MQERKSSCVNSYKQYANHNYLVGIIKKLIYQAFNKCYCHEKTIFTIDFFNNLICLWSLNYKSLKKTLNTSCIQDIDFGLNRILECKLGNKLHIG